MNDNLEARFEQVAHKPDGITRTSMFSWVREVSRYQWLVLVVAWLGWVFDSMDGTLYSLVQKDRKSVV